MGFEEMVKRWSLKVGFALLGILIAADILILGEALKPEK
jgi:hypothetical protein